MHVWRLSKAKFAKAAFSGEGARLFEGRWNFAGVPMVYTSTSLALAAIEFFVHLDPSDAPDDLVSVPAEIPDELTREKVDVRDLPPDWRKLDNKNLQRLGSDWAKAKRSVALKIPSAVVDGEWNVLLNPLHTDFQKIKIRPPKPFSYDERMFK
jgi:RES domain-containing protein